MEGMNQRRLNGAGAREAEEDEAGVSRDKRGKLNVKREKETQCQIYTQSTCAPNAASKLPYNIFE